MSSAEDFTPIQWEALKATADRHLRPVEDLAAEILPLVQITPAEVRGRPDNEPESTVNNPLTPTTELPRPLPETFSITFTAATSPQECTS